MSFLFLFFVVLVFTTRSPVGFTLFLSACPRVPHFPPCRGKFFSQTERRTHWNFWNTAWFFLRPPLFTLTGCVRVCVCAHFSWMYSYVTQRSQKVFRNILGKYTLYMCVFVRMCLCMWPRRIKTDRWRESVCAAVHSYNLSSSPVFSLPFSTSLLPHFYHPPPPPSLFLFLKNTSTGMCVHAFFSVIQCRGRLSYKSPQLLTWLLNATNAPLQPSVEALLHASIWSLSCSGSAESSSSVFHHGIGIKKKMSVFELMSSFH